MESLQCIVSGNDCNYRKMPSLLLKMTKKITFETRSLDIGDESFSLLSNVWRLVGLMCNV